MVVSLGSIWAPLGHFGSLSGERCEKAYNLTSKWTSKWDGFRYIFDLFIILRVLWRELGGHLFLGIFLAMFSERPGSGINVRFRNQYLVLILRRGGMEGANNFRKEKNQRAELVPKTSSETCVFGTSN